MEKYFKIFVKELNTGINQIPLKEIDKFIKILQLVYERKGRIYLIGNGGSSAIASHFANDLNKTILGSGPELKRERFQAICLSDNIPLLTAWANDYGYENIFSEQLKNFIQKEDVLIIISSSGNSPNIIKAIKIAKDFNVPVIGLLGFDGGKALSLVDAKVHVSSHKYEIVESAHSAIMHFVIIYFKDIFLHGIE